jgi:hypothetical protein
LYFGAVTVPVSRGGRQAIKKPREIIFGSVGRPEVYWTEIRVDTAQA